MRKRIDARSNLVILSPSHAALLLYFFVRHFSCAALQLNEGLGKSIQMRYYTLVLVSVHSGLFKEIIQIGRNFSPHLCYQSKL